MIVKIKDKEINLKFSFRSLMIYENIMKKSFTPESTTDVLVFMFCVLISSDKGLEIEFNDFLDYVDENPYLIVEFSEWFTKEMTKADTISPDDEDGGEGEDKKKVKKK